MAIIAIVLGASGCRSYEPNESGRSESAEQREEVVGVWHDQMAKSISATITILRHQGGLRANYRFNSGGEMNQDLTERVTSIGRLFEQKAGNHNGEWYVLLKDGNLQLWDRDGLIRTASNTRKHSTAGVRRRTKAERGLKPMPRRPVAVTTLGQWRRLTPAMKAAKCVAFARVCQPNGKPHELRRLAAELVAAINSAAGNGGLDTVSLEETAAALFLILEESR